MTTRVHCDNKGCDQSFNEEHSSPPGWLRLEAIGPQILGLSDTKTRHFHDTTCLHMWSKPNADHALTRIAR